MIATVIHMKDSKNLKDLYNLYKVVKLHGLDLEAAASNENAFLLVDNGRPVPREDLYPRLRAIKGVTKVEERKVMFILKD